MVWRRVILVKAQEVRALHNLLLFLVVDEGFRDRQIVI